MKKQRGMLSIIFLLASVFALSFAVNAQIKIPKMDSRTNTQIPAPVVGGRYLFWDRVAVNPSGFTDCLGLGEITMTGFQNVNKTRSEVSGFYGTNYASISCLNNTAYIIVIGGDSKKTREVRDALRGRFLNNQLTLPIASTIENNNYLYVVTKKVLTATEEGCLTIARGAMQSQFGNAKKSESEITGSLGESYASIACQKTGSNFTAVVMVVGSNNRRTAQITESLGKKVATTVLIDNGTELNPVDN